MVHGRMSSPWLEMSYAARALTYGVAQVAPDVLAHVRRDVDLPEPAGVLAVRIVGAGLAAGLRQRDRGPGRRLVRREPGSTRCLVDLADSQFHLASPEPSARAACELGPGREWSLGPCRPPWPRWAGSVRPWGTGWVSTSGRRSRRPPWTTAPGRPMLGLGNRALTVPSVVVPRRRRHLPVRRGRRPARGHRAGPVRPRVQAPDRRHRPDPAGRPAVLAAGALRQAAGLGGLGRHRTPGRPPGRGGRHLPRQLGRLQARAARPAGHPRRRPATR